MSSGTAGTTADRNVDGGTPKTSTRGGRAQQQRTRVAIPTVIKFKGNNADLSGCIFDCSDHRQADVYTTAIKRIAKYVGRSYKHGGDISQSLTNGVLLQIAEP